MAASISMLMSNKCHKFRWHELLSILQTIVNILHYCFRILWQPLLQPTTIFFSLSTLRTMALVLIDNAFTDERWKGTCWKDIANWNKYISCNSRWKRTYAAYGGFLLYHITRGSVVRELYLFHYFPCFSCDPLTCSVGLCNQSIWHWILLFLSECEI